MSDIAIDPRYSGAVPERPDSRLIEEVIVTPIKEFVDDRQSLSVYLKASDPFYKGFAQSYATRTARGVVKAWHYHLHQTDVWYVPWGKIKVGLFDARKNSPTCGTANAIIMGGGNNVTLVIPPGVFHGYVTLSEESILINTTDQPYNAQDEYRAEWNDPRFDFSWEVENR